MVPLTHDNWLLGVRCRCGLLWVCCSASRVLCRMVEGMDPLTISHRNWLNNTTSVPWWRTGTLVGRQTCSFQSCDFWRSSSKLCDRQLTVSRRFYTGPVWSMLVLVGVDGTAVDSKCPCSRFLVKN